MPGQPGEPPQVTLGELIDAPALVKNIGLNGSPLEVKPLVRVNGGEEPFTYILQDRDKISLTPITSYRELFSLLDITLERTLSFFLNGKEQTAGEKLELVVDGLPCPLDTPIRSGQDAAYLYKPWTLRDLFPVNSQHIPGIVVQVNGKLRSKVELPADADESVVKTAALTDEHVQKFIGEKEPTKVIYIPGRLVNVVVR